MSPFGNFSRNPALGPSFFGTDLALSKTFGATADGLRVQFRAEAYNLFNHTNFTPASGGTIGSTYPARILQFGLKVNY